MSENEKQLLESMTEEKMPKLKISTMVVEIMEYFKRHNLSVQDAKYILHATNWTIDRSMYPVECKTKIESPQKDEVSWACSLVPKLNANSNLVNDLK